MPTPTSRSLERLRELGFTAQVVERWCPHSRRRVDLFGVIDIVAVRKGNGIIGIQSCAGSSHAARRAKILDEPRAAVWLAAGGKIEVWSWSKRGPRGKRKVWTLRREPVPNE